MKLKGIWKYVIAVLIFTLTTVMLAVLGHKAKAEYKEVTCSGIKVEIAEQDGLTFVTDGDVMEYMAGGYGNCSGKRLEEIDLARIEEILDGKSAILKSEAYTTRDGILHIIITQRVPVVRLVSGRGGWYADSEGYLFPLQKNYTSRVPIVAGSIPLNIKSGFKGIPATAAERQWLGGILDLVDFLSRNRRWDDAIAQIHVNGNGHVIIVPRKGREKFYMGRPEEFEKKFAKIENYYRYIVPEKGQDAYSYVNVSFDGQIVCRK